MSGLSSPAMACTGEDNATRQPLGKGCECTTEFIVHANELFDAKLVNVFYGLGESIDGFAECR
jgi:hypothetical protein